MSAPTTVRSATRRLVGLTALRWLPVGLTTPITVLLAQARGLSLAEIGLLFTVHGVVVHRARAADRRARRRARPPPRRRRRRPAAPGRRCVVFATATSLPGFLAGVLLIGVGRALDSGPVEAWYVDTVHRIDPGGRRRARPVPALGGRRRQPRASARSSAASCPGCSAGPAPRRSALPYLVAAVLDLVFVVAVVRLLTEDRPPREGSVRRRAGRGRAGRARHGGAARSGCRSPTGRCGWSCC